MKTFLFFGLFFTAIIGQAQLKNFTIHADANLPLIRSVENSEVMAALPIPTTSGFSFIPVNVGGLKESYTAKAGFRLGSKIDYSISKQFFITIGISLDYLRYQRSIEITKLNSTPSPTMPTTIVFGKPFGSFYGVPLLRDQNGNPIVGSNGSVAIAKRSEDFGNTTTLSLQVPVCIGKSFLKEKLVVKTGIIFNYLLSATQVTQSITTPTTTFIEEKQTTKEGFNEFLTGATMQGTYLVSPKIGIDVTVQKFFTPIYTGSYQSAGKAKLNTVSLGLSYSLN
jgi:hypothetical protein